MITMNYLKVFNFIFKVVLVGDAGVGKTHMMNRLIIKIFRYVRG